MTNQNYHQSLIDLYYEESSKTLEGLASEYGVSVEQCQKDYQLLELVSNRFESLPDHEPSQMTINKLMVHAKERNRQKNKPWFEKIFGYSYSWGLAVMALLVFTVSFNSDHFTNSTNVASITPIKTLAPTKQLLVTPLDHFPLDKGYQYVGKPRTKTMLTNASTNNTPLTDPFAFDEALELKMMSKALNVQDVQTLYFRARKFEKLGYVKHALRDYMFIAQNYPKFEYKQSLPIAIARCYERLDNKKAAIDILGQYQKVYGENEDILFWIDQLKSETL
jgi:hypothetical protein